MRGLILLFTLILSFGSLNAQNADIELLRSINLDRNKSLDPVFSVFSQSAAPVSMLYPSTVYAIGFFKRDSTIKRKGLYIAGSMAVNTIVTLGMKHSINRPRPFTTYPDIEKLSSGGSPSFPSGHTSIAFNTATAITFAYPKWYVALPSYTWASAVGYSRMHLGVHYPSDVLVGAIVGVGSAWFSHWLNQKLFQPTEKR